MDTNDRSFQTQLNQLITAKNVKLHEVCCENAEKKVNGNVCKSENLSVTLSPQLQRHACKLSVLVLVDGSRVVQTRAAYPSLNVVWSDAQMTKFKPEHLSYPTKNMPLLHCQAVP
jgi:hypothetical protein